MGATGSIGENTLQVVRKHPDRLQLVGISAHSNAEKLAQIATEFNVPHAYLPEAAGKAENFPSATKLDRSADGLLSLASLDNADLVVIAVVGASGLSPTLAALQAGKNIVLANKES
ncbi:MAG: 1-deoxy-D-xylulose-5-phosphate reductoisomerase, partial [Rhodobacteraceae bacterium]|nr:1-deoxy-D-xylulose-5-phosphate reductoisomerase [Paracoccaceae bacterium]